MPYCIVFSRDIYVCPEIQIAGICSSMVVKASRQVDRQLDSYLHIQPAALVSRAGDAQYDVGE